MEEKRKSESYSVIVHTRVLFMVVEVHIEKHNQISKGLHNGPSPIEE